MIFALSLNYLFISAVAIYWLGYVPPNIGFIHLVINIQSLMSESILEPDEPYFFI